MERHPTDFVYSKNFFRGAEGGGLDRQTPIAAAAAAAIAAEARRRKECAFHDSSAAAAASSAAASRPDIALLSTLSRMAPLQTRGPFAAEESAAAAAVAAAAAAAYGGMAIGSLLNVS